MQTDSFIGKQVGGFTVHERIGRGGMASVYRAYQPSVNRSVALKIILLDGEVGEKGEFRRRFSQEANIIASLEHLHILPVYDYGIERDEIAYLAMRLLRGGTLTTLLMDGALPLNRTAEIFTQFARGLAYAHSRGVIHRDLKPGNIMLDDADNAYLTDFGLAKLIENSQHMTKTGNVVGTPTYMSPEQLRGDAIDHRSDIYSLGVILYHMLVGHPPFESSDSNVISIIYQHLEKPPRPPSEINPHVTPEVEAVALKALQKKPEDRYNSANAMAAALNEALGRSTGSTPITVGERSGSSEDGIYKFGLSKPPSSTMAMLASDHTPRVAVPIVVPSAPIEEATSPSTSPPSMILVNDPRRGIRQLRWGFAVVAVLTVIAAILLFANRSTVRQFSSSTVLAGESQSAESAAPTADELSIAQAHLGESGFIAYITCNQNSEYHAGQAREMRDFAANDGLDFRVYDSDDDKGRQLTMIERARTDGALALIVCPLDLELLAESFASIHEANVPLVLMSSGIDGNGAVLIAGNDYAMGEAAGRAAGAIIQTEMDGAANVVVLDYPELQIIVNRVAGIEAGLHEAAPEAQIVAQVLGGTQENGERSVRDLIANDMAFDAIVSINDAGAFGAIMALEAEGVLPSEVVISSVDAEALARQYISEDYFMRASVDVGREQFARTAINAAAKLLAGATLAETLLSPPGEVITRAVLLDESENGVETTQEAASEN